MAGKKDLKIKFQDMTLSIKYDKIVPDEAEKETQKDSADIGEPVVEQIETDDVKVEKDKEAKPKKKVGRPRKRRK